MKKLNQYLFALWMVVSGIAGSPTPCIANSDVRLNTNVELSRDTVKLSDLFIGVPPAIDRDIAQAPPACKPATYDEAVLKKLADTYRLDWKDGAGIDQVIVSSPCAQITGDMLRDAVIAKIKADTSLKKANMEVVFDTRTTEINLPLDHTPVFSLDRFSFDAGSKQFRGTLVAETLKGPYVLPVSGRVTIKRSVPVLAHRLEAGTIIGANDLDFIELPEEKITADVVTEINQLVGREMRRDLAEGDMLRSRDIIPPRLVLRNTMVTMTIQTPFMLITAQGKAQEDGGEGDVVRVVNTQSNRMVEGVVTGPGTIEVRTTRQVALAE